MSKIAMYFNGRTLLGGAERRLGRVFNRLAKKGVEVVFVFKLYEPINEVKKAYEQVIGNQCQIKMEGFYKAKEIYKYVRGEHFDYVFYSDAYRDMIPFFLGAKSVGSSLVMLQVTTGPSIGVFSSRCNKLLFHLVALGSDRIDCLYPSTVTRFKEKYKKQIVTATPCPATELDIFRPSSKKKQIAFIGRWVEGKNVEMFTEAMLSIENILYMNGYHVLLCGNKESGEIESRVKELLTKAKHPEVFRLMGYVHAEEVLPATEVFFSLQDFNNYPSQSLIEAIACGCYIIASNEGDTAEIVKKEFGCLCQLNHESIVQSLMIYFEMDIQRKQRVIDEAVQFAREKFSFQNSERHYYDMISGHSL